MLCVCGCERHWDPSAIYLSCCYLIAMRNFNDIYSLSIHIEKIFTFFLWIFYLQTYIPLQSFNVERPKDLPLYAESSKSNRKYAVDILEKYSKQFDLATSGDSNSFPVLKIEEDFDDIPMTNGTCKTISTQTSPVNELNAGRNNKKGSSNSLWTSDESILRRSAETVDDDTKSSSSSACEETGGVMSSGKSGESFSPLWKNMPKIFKKNYIILFSVEFATREMRVYFGMQFIFLSTGMLAHSSSFSS